MNRTKASAVKVDVIRFDAQNITFNIKGVDVSVANALRRVMIADVQTVAIDLVEIIENSSVLCDEFLAHRLGMIPLDSKKAPELRKPFEYAGDDDSATDVHLELNVRCHSDQARDITSEDLVSYDERVRPVLFKGATSGSTNSGGVLIAKLRKNQQISLKCIARKGSGKDHAKWSPVATAVFKPDPVVQINESIMKSLTGTTSILFVFRLLMQLIEAEKQSIVESDPSKMFKYDTDLSTITLASPESCTYDGEIMKKVSISTPASRSY